MNDRASTWPLGPAWSRRARWVVAAGFAVFFAGLDVGHFAVNHIDGGAIFGLVASLLALTILLRWREEPARTLVAITVLVASIDAVASGPVRSVQLALVAVALYRYARRATLRDTATAGTLAWAAMAISIAGRFHNYGQLPSNLFVLTAASAIGLYGQSRGALIDAYRQRAEQAEREQQLMASRAVGAERVRIARDLHDIVAHHVSLLVVQAGAVRETLPPDHPSREVLTSMADGGRQAMTELRDMLSALRAASEVEPGQPAGLGKGRGDGIPAPARTPQPDLADLPALVAGARAAGITVELRRAPTGPIPPSIGLAAFRIIQEALTNVVKHAPGSQTVVEVDERDGGLELRVRNRLPAGVVGSPPGEGGHGLMGMRERAGLCHGWVKAGPAAGGFEVHVFLPVPAADPVLR